MSELYLARPLRGPESGASCVVKRLLPERAEDPDAVALFLDEARINLLLDHPNIVSVFDVGRDGGDLYLVMDHVDGVDLRWLLNAARRTGRRIPPAVALYVTAELLGALDHAHGARDSGGRPLRLVHRDISPENVLLGHDGSVRLADFGAARAAVSRSPRSTTTALGKLGYMAPELLERRQATVASDLFAAGLLLFEMLALRALQRAESPRSAYEFWLGFEPTQEIPATVPLGEGGALLVRALERDPARRYRSAGSFRSQVDELRLRRGERSGPRDLSELLETLQSADGMGERVTTSPVEIVSSAPSHDRWSRREARAGGAVPWSPGDARRALRELTSRPGGWRVRVWLEGTEIELAVVEGALLGVRTREGAGDGAARWEPGGEQRGRDPLRGQLDARQRRTLVRRILARRVSRFLRWKQMWSHIDSASDLVDPEDGLAPRLDRVVDEAWRALERA